MIEKNITISNKKGLHARAATKLAKTAMAFSAKLEIHCNGKQADGKSVMSILLLAATCGTETRLITNGEDETEMMTAMVDLFTNKFGEEI
jgi:phosphocarrier protein